jgi:hypothetical protein
VDPKTVTRWAVSGRIGSIRMVVVAADLVWVLYSTVIEKLQSHYGFTRTPFGKEK